MLKAVFTFSLMFLLFSVSFGQVSSNKQEKVIFKANTEFSIQLETAFDTEKNSVGDNVNFILNEDVNGDGQKMLKGSLVYGRIVSVEKISAKNDTAKACIMFDFVKNGGDFISLVAAVIAIEPNTESIKLSASKMFSDGTLLSLKDKEISMDKGRIFRVKLTKDIVSE